jgi:hypothetical protein
MNGVKLAKDGILICITECTYYAFIQYFYVGEEDGNTSVQTIEVTRHEELFFPNPLHFFYSTKSNNHGYTLLRSETEANQIYSIITVLHYNENLSRPLIRN